MEASRRSCPYCHKEFVKPSDLKRHLMVHTGEKPYVCQFCKKGFKQPQSLNYHLKAAHKVNIPLSQGLEERYLRLKTRAAMRDLAAMESWTPKAGTDPLSASALYNSDLSSSSYADSRPQSRETEKENPQHLLSAIPQPLTPCSSFSPDFKHGLVRQTSVASEGSWTEDRALGPNMIEVELPQFPGLNGSLGEDSGSGARKVPMMVKKETMLLTQLDGVCPITKQDMQVFRCCLCDKVCASMFHAFCHLSSHFEHTHVGLECRACNLAFTSQPEMDDHYLRKHNVCLNELDLQNNNHKFKALRNEDRTKHSYSHLDASGKSFQPIDDHNNNNDDHINKEHTTACSNASSPEPSSSPLLNYSEEGSAGFLEGLEPSETLKGSSGKGAYRCPKCSKCYLTKFLLDRHVAFHTRQDLIEAAMKSGASVNGAHKDLLLQPPPVVPQDSDRYLQLQELELALKAQQEEQEEEEESLQEDQDPYSGESSTKQQGAKMDGEDFEKAVDPAKALLEQEGIEEDVVVVMPTDPDFDEGDVSAETDLGSEVKDDEVCEPEIHAAPKRQLIPPKSETSPSKLQKSEPSPSKSRRKSTLPTKHRSAIRHADSAPVSDVSPPTSTYPTEEEPNPEPSASTQETEGDDAQSCSSSPKEETPADAVSESPAETENDENSKEFQETSQVPESFFQNLHSAFGRMPPGLLSNLYSSNGLFPPASLASATAGLYVVNQPVDRERLCKPTVLPDGRTVFRCIFCHKDFLSYSDINRHMDFHEDIRPYKCNFCDYYARTNSQLKVHMMRHQGIREYCCQLCKYKGVTQSDLNRHMKSQIHLLKSQNECSRCGEGFVTPKTLEKHLATSCKGSRKRKEKPDN